jgi:trehalose 6-phosphate synthase/phosphatase
MLRTLLLRFALPMIAAIVIASFFALPYVNRMLGEWFHTDVGLRAELIVHSIETPLAELVANNDETRYAKYLDSIVSAASHDDERASSVRIAGILLCDAANQLIYRTPAAPLDATCGAFDNNINSSRIVRSESGNWHMLRSGLIDVVASPPLNANRLGRSTNTPPASAISAFRLIVIHDLRFADRRQATMRDYFLAFAILSALALILLMMGAAWLLIRSLFRGLIADIRGKRFLDEGASHRSTIPVLSQVRQALRDIERDQRLEIEFQENWTPEALRHVVKQHLGEPEIMVVSNREPYVHHTREDGVIEMQLPASGMVTALEPITRACGGMWIAHGSGSADKKTVDRHDHVRVPPANPAYTLRRIWLSAEEEDGYYYGFSNEGIWPLCHLAYVRPQFRANDWRLYSVVNQKFADAVAAEAKTSSPLVLVQDYHLALAPRFIRNRLPDATIVVFWHIPWPNAETFGVCPWKDELLLGLLNADILGFHTHYHCQNFLATVDRFIECQIDRERMTVQLKDHVCHIAAYPISIEWPPRWLEDIAKPARCREMVRQLYGIAPDVKIGVGIERWDFTKGILERFLAIESFLEQHPEQIGHIVFLQVAAPTRNKLPAYQRLQAETEATAKRINERFAKVNQFQSPRKQWQPIILINTHQEPPQVFTLLRACDFCLVNSLHDGMNLVAKEFVASREDEDGVLILSTFAGASRELVEAILINPYAIDDTAEAIRIALAMPRAERQERMQLMRLTVKENNVYRWAGRMLVDASRIRRHQRLLGKSVKKDHAHV